MPRDGFFSRAFRSLHELVLVLGFGKAFPEGKQNLDLVARSQFLILTHSIPQFSIVCFFLAVRRLQNRRKHSPSREQPRDGVDGHVFLARISDFKFDQTRFDSLPPIVGCADLQCAA